MSAEDDDDNDADRQAVDAIEEARRMLTAGVPVALAALYEVAGRVAAAQEPPQAS